MRIIATGIALFCALSFGTFSWAEEGDGKVARLDQVVVTATKTEVPEEELTRAVSVVLTEGADQTQGTLLMESLRDVPGTMVRRSGTPGRTTSVVVRGSNNRQVHVTIDGAHAASPTTGFFDFNHITTDNLERIEILRGPGSTLYGSDAMGGVINLVTKRGQGPLQLSATSSWSSMLNTFREALSLQGEVGQWALSGSAARLDSEGLSENDAYENLNISARVGYNFSEETTFDFIFRHTWGLVGIDDGSFRPDPNRTSRERLTLGTFRLENPITDWWSQVVRFSAQVGNTVSNDPSNGVGNADSIFKLDFERYGFEWMHRLNFVDWNTTTLGFEIEDREADNRRFDKALVNRAVYIQNQWQPIDPLTFVLGGRAFRESTFGSDEVWEASVAYFLESLGLKLRAGFGKAFRVPTLNELFFPNFGNENLDPEQSKTTEFGFDQTLWKGLVNWSSTVFRTDYRGLIQFTNVGGTVLPINVSRARVDGVETEVEFLPTDHWRLRGSYTYLDAVDRPSGEELLRLPNNTFGFSLAYLPSEKWQVRLESLTLSSQEESRSGGRDKLDGRTTLDFYGEYRFRPEWTGYLRVDNLTSQSYSEVLGFAAPGTVVTLGIKAKR